MLFLFAKFNKNYKQNEAAYCFASFDHDLSKGDTVLENLNNKTKFLPEALHIEIKETALSTIYATDKILENQTTLGEIILRKHPEKAHYDLMRFALIVDAEHLGIASEVARFSTAQIKYMDDANPGGIQFELDIATSSFVSHKSLGGGYFFEEANLHIPQHLPFAGSLKITISYQENASNSWLLKNLSYEAKSSHLYETDEPLFDRITGVWTENASLQVTKLDHLSLSARDNPELEASTLPSQALPRVLKVRPIWFTTSPLENEIPIEILDFIRTQMTEAIELWANAQIHIKMIWENDTEKRPYRATVTQNLERGIISLFTIPTGVSYDAGDIAGIINNSNLSAEDIVLYNYLMTDTSTKIAGLKYINIPLAASVKPTLLVNGARNDWEKAIYAWLKNSPSRPVSQGLGIIDIYFTNFTDSPITINGNFLKQGGGAETLGANTAFANIIVTDRPLPGRDKTSAPNKKRWMDYLVAHELGHVIGLDHPWTSDKDLHSDGQLVIPRMKVIGYRTDDGPIENPDMILRAQYMIQGFDSSIAPSVASGKYSSPGTNINTDFVAIGSDLNTVENQQSYIDALAGCAAPLNISENPILIFIVNDPDADAYYIGMSAAPSFPVPVVILNRAKNISCNEDKPWKNCFPIKIYEFITRPPMYRAKFGTIMDSQTPDPAVLDELACNAVANGITNSSIEAKLMMNPALLLEAGKSAAPFKATKTFGMYIPSRKGDVGRLGRTDLQYNSSFYVWNSPQALSELTLKNFREKFFDPETMEPSHIPPRYGSESFLYIHVRMRANCVPANLADETSLANFFKNKTRVYLGYSNGSPGFSTIHRLGEKRYCTSDQLVDCIIYTNQDLVVGSPTEYIARAHPFVAGFTFCYPWRVSREMGREPFWLNAFVINQDEPLLDENKRKIVDWNDVTRIGYEWKMSSLQLSSPTWMYLRTQNLQWVSRLMRPIS